MLENDKLFVMIVLQASGVEYLSEILSSPTSTESVKAEAASVIAQITSPSIDNYHHLLGFIEYMEDLLKELTGNKHFYGSRFSC